ncbi:MAG: MotE family protein [Opitutaceae bacterium]
MKVLLSPYLIIILAAVLGVATVAFTLLQQIPRLADMAVAMRPKAIVVPSHLPERPPPVDPASQAVSELILARQQLAVREASLLEQQKRLASERMELERTRASLEIMRKQVDEYITEAKRLQMKANSEEAAMETKNLKTLVQTYSNMSPKACVAILREMEDATAVKILALMKVDVVASLFEEMAKQAAGDPQMAKRAAKLSEGVKNQRSSK